MTDERYLHPSIGTVALMVERRRELRIFTADSGHSLNFMVAENYRPTLNPTGDGARFGGTGKSVNVEIRKPYTIDKLIAALEWARDRAEDQL